MFWLSEEKPVTIESVAPGTILVHKTDGTVKRQEYSGGTDEYYHQEEAANYLCTPEKHVRIEIKDASGKIYRYDQAALKRLGWL